MKLLSFFILITLLSISCNNSDNKKNTENRSVLSSYEDKSIIKDEFSKLSTEIPCKKKQLLVLYDYKFYYCKDSVEFILESELPDTIILNNPDTIVFLSRQLSFNALYKKDKIKSIRYKHSESSYKECKELYIEPLDSKKNHSVSYGWDCWIR